MALLFPSKVALPLQQLAYRLKRVTSKLCSAEKSVPKSFQKPFSLPLCRHRLRQLLFLSASVLLEAELTCQRIRQSASLLISPIVLTESSRHVDQPSGITYRCIVIALFLSPQIPQAIYQAALMAQLTILKPHFTPSSNTSNPPSITTLIKSLGLQPHIEGGFYLETDRAPETFPSPFPFQPTSTSTEGHAPQRPGFDPAVRNTSTTIYYLLTPSGPQGGFHRNKARTVHNLHRGRGRYVIIHADEPANEGSKRIESFVVGHNVEKGERLQWIVEGGKFKASFLLPDIEGGEGSEGLLISETVVPGFEFCDHDFLSAQGLKTLVGLEQAKELAWLLSPLGTEKD